jgi:hypothetical protein
MVNIEGLSRAAVLAALWNNSRSQGITAVFQNRQTPMTEEQAQEHLNEQSYFDYLKGRVLKVRLEPDAKEFNPALYDRDNGEGAASFIIGSLRAGIV